MKKISDLERHRAGHIYCPYCKPQRINAVWRVEGYYDKRYDVACEKHKDKLKRSTSNHPTETDDQTWTWI